MGSGSINFFKHLNMDTELLNYFFSLDVAEANPSNDWTKKFLMGWTGSFEPEKSKIQISHREMIIVEPRSRDYFQPQKELGQTKEVNELHDVRINGEYVDWVETHFKIFATYSSTFPREINYYKDYYDADEQIKSVVRIHERMHAYHHINREGVWKSFGTTSTVYKEFLAQIFTFKCVKGTDLQPSFETLSRSQPYVYKTWESSRELSNAQVMALYKEIKETGKSSFGDLEKLAKVYDQKLSAQLSSKPDIERLNEAHDEIFKNIDGFLDKRINNDVSDNMEEIW